MRDKIDRKKRFKISEKRVFESCESCPHRNMLKILGILKAGLVSDMNYIGGLVAAQLRQGGARQRGTVEEEGLILAIMAATIGLHTERMNWKSVKTLSQEESKVGMTQKIMYQMMMFSDNQELDV